MPHTLSLLLAAVLWQPVPAVTPPDCPRPGAPVAVGPMDAAAARLTLLRCVRVDLERGAWQVVDDRLAAARAAAPPASTVAGRAWLALVDRLTATRIVDARAWQAAASLARPLRASTSWLETMVVGLATARRAWATQDAAAFARALDAARTLAAQGSAAGDVEVLRAARLVQAAVAGGQYERDEMLLLLDEAHATERALAETLGEAFVPVVLARELEADLLLQTDRYRAAAERYREVILTRPGRVQSWLGLAAAYARLGHDAQAAQCAARARALAPGFAYAAPPGPQ